jgi:hypothetical protein
MAKEDKIDIRNAKRTASAMRKGSLRVSNKAAVQFNKEYKEKVKSGRVRDGIKVKSSGTESLKFGKTNSPRKPSVAVKTGVKNKMKAQGAKTMKSSTSGYNRRGKK